MGNLCSTDQQLLLQAASRGDTEDVAALLAKRGKNKASVNLKDKTGYTALHRAAETGHGPVVKLLVERGANLELTTDTGFTALCLAAKTGNAGVVKTLVNAGANIEAADMAFGCTALLWAVQHSNADTIRFLCERGADLETRSRFGQTPLMYSAENGNADKARILLEFGADVKTKDSRGGTALSRARAKGYTAVAEILDAAIKKKDNPEGSTGKDSPRPEDAARGGVNSLKRSSSSGKSDRDSSRSAERDETPRKKNSSRSNY